MACEHLSSAQETNGRGGIRQLGTFSPRPGLPSEKRSWEDSSEVRLELGHLLPASRFCPGLADYREIRQQQQGDVQLHAFHARLLLIRAQIARDRLIVR